jgi:hypothetical protein
MARSRFARIGRVLAGFALVTLPPALAAQGVTITLKAWREPVLMDTLRQEHHLRAAPSLVYDATLKAFAQLDIPTGRTDGARGIIGSERFERAHSIVGLPMSRSFNCGESPIGPNADAFRLEIAIVAWVTDAKPGTTIAFAAVADGRDPSGIGRAVKDCASLGTIETKLLEAVTKIVGG